MERELEMEMGDGDGMGWVVHLHHCPVTTTRSDKYVTCVLLLRTDLVTEAVQGRSM